MELTRRYLFNGSAAAYGGRFVRPQRAGHHARMDGNTWMWLVAALLIVAGIAGTVLPALPGIPLLYYGDEVGLAGAGDPDNRRMLPEDSALSLVQLGTREFVWGARTLRGDAHGVLVRRGASGSRTLHQGGRPRRQHRHRCDPR